MNIRELLQKIEAKHPSLFEALPKKEAVVLVKAVFDNITKALDETDDGVVKIGGLGSFRVRHVERKKGNGAGIVKRIVFASASERKANNKTAKGNNRKKTGDSDPAES